MRRSVPRGHIGARALAIALVIFSSVLLGPQAQAAADGARHVLAPSDAYAKVMQDATVVQGLLDQFWTADLKSQNLQFYPPTRYEYYNTTGNSSCNSDPKPMPRNAYYCYPDRYVAFDIDWLASYLDRHPGGATTFLILSHEWGHAVQDAWMRQQPGVDSWNPEYRQELQADCLSGVFMGAAISRGAIIEEAGDGDAVYSWLSEAGTSPWTDPGDHGSSQQRQSAFFNGYHNSSSYCRQYDF